jgi:hypothetical protein
VSFQMCSQTTRQNRFKFRNGHCFHICKENFLKSFEDYGRRIAALNDKNTIRAMKKGATKTKKVLGLWKLRTCLDLMIPNRPWRHDRLQKVLLANVKAMAISEFESILTSCLRTHLKTHWGEFYFFNFFINNAIRVEVVEPKRFDFESGIA